MELVKPGSKTAHARRQISWQAAVACAGGDEQAETLLRRLSGQAVDGANRAEHDAVRLILLPTETDETGAVKTRVDLIHETLLRTRPDGKAYWPHFWEEIKRRDDFLATRTRLEAQAQAQAQAWDKHQDDSMLAKGRDLELFLPHLKTAEGETLRFLEASKALLEASKAQRKKQRRSLIYRLVSGMAVISVIAALYWHGNYWIDQTARADWNAYLQQWRVWLGCPSTPILVTVPPTEASEYCYRMGSDTSERADEKPAHNVCFDQRFDIGKYEVTFDQYDSFSLMTGIGLEDDEGWGRGDRPVINMSWNQANDYAEWLSIEKGLNCRLPTETEWEYAARAGTTTKYALPAPNGRDDIAGKGLANCDGCGSEWDKKETAPVGSFDPNAWGLHDMHGNAWEWTEDYWHKNYDKAPTDGSARLAGSDSSSRVVRGGAWGSDPDLARSADRRRINPGHGYRFVGFRVLCSGPLKNH